MTRVPLDPQDEDLEVDAHGVWQVIACCDVATSVGVRDKAILLFMARAGALGRRR